MRRERHDAEHEQADASKQAESADDRSAAEAAAEDEEAQQSEAEVARAGKDWLGAHVQQKLKDGNEMRWYLGKVVKVIEKTGRSTLFRVRYDDGESADMKEAEIQGALMGAWGEPKGVCTEGVEMLRAVQKKVRKEPSSAACTARLPLK